MCSERKQIKGLILTRQIGTKRDAVKNLSTGYPHTLSFSTLAIVSSFFRLAEVKTMRTQVYPSSGFWDYLPPFFSEASIFFFEKKQLI